MPSPSRRRPSSNAGRNGQRRQRLQRVEETSAGGLVIDRSSGPVPQAALIGRLDRRGRLLWSLPKGHLEEGETAEAAAIREVMEETGITGRVVAPLGTIDFWFVAEGRRIHKTVHHFLLLATAGELSADDIEVAQVEWVPIAELGDRLAYADERRLVEQVPQLLADTA
jgi:8-oxo-dGTP pyrophosphatase MutT (NUDIX family)